MNEKEKREYYQRVHSKNAIEIESPLKTSKKRENLESIISLRFSGYELALLRKLSKKRKITLSALIRSFVLDSLQNEARPEEVSNIHFLPTVTVTGTLVTDLKSLQEKKRSQTLMSRAE